MCFDGQKKYMFWLDNIKDGTQVLPYPLIEGEKYETFYYSWWHDINYLTAEVYPFRKRTSGVILWVKDPQ